MKFPVDNGFEVPTCTVESDNFLSCSSSVVFVQLNARKQKSNAAHWIRKMMLEILNRSYFKNF